MAGALILFGSGGHAKVVLEAIRAAMPDCPVSVLDDDPAATGRTLLGLPIAGGRHWLESNPFRGSVVPAIGTNSARAALIEWLAGLDRPLASVVHPSAILSPTAIAYHHKGGPNEGLAYPTGFDAFKWACARQRRRPTGRR